MRLIKFRGKPIGGGQFIYGNLSYREEDGREYYAIQEQNFEGREYEVDPETVGQFTGLFDENDKEIYEGDIMLNPYERHMGFVHFTDAQWFGAGDSLCEALRRHSTVIGNIHDNAELLNFLD